MPRYSKVIDIIVSPHYGFNELDKRISAKKCELCGAENTNFEIHHINKLKNLKGKELWERMMISRKRKTLGFVKNAIIKFMAENFVRNQHKWRAGYLERGTSGWERGLCKPITAM